MSIDADDEILQDFLVEAGELLELLGEQLMELEQSPEDADLLNAVFRSFHTIKGGAGFLGINPLVEVCHRAEDVFNILRNGERVADAELMDVILTVTDVVNVMFDSVRAGEDPDPAEPELLTNLERYTVPAGEESPAPAEAVETAATNETPESVEQEFDAMVSGEASAESSDGAPVDGSDDISDDEFEALLDELHGKGSDPGKSSANAAAEKPSGSTSDEITDDEFEALLDEIHGEGGGPGATGAKPEANDSKPAAASNSDDISDDEFEALLDDLHGKGASPGKSDDKNESSTPTPPASRTDGVAAKVEAEKVEAAKPAEVKPEPAKKEPKAAPAKKASTAETSVRVDTARLDRIMNMVGELVLVRNRLQTLRSAMADEDVTKAVANLDVVTSDLQLTVMKTRMQPIKKVFGRFPRVVRDLARSLNKKIDLQMVGEETDLDKNLVEALADPLVHLVRNAVDHGIEMPEDREASGKPVTGNVLLSAAQEGDHILLSIKDDGKGMDPNVLRKMAVEKGLMDTEAAARLDDKECYNLIFAAGFSTKQEISDVSGRGVGMDVVKTRITQMNGTVEIDSKLGTGSEIIVKVPLTLAIMPTLMVKLETQIFALPLANVVEIFNLDMNPTNVVDGQRVVVVRDKALPLFFLRDWLVQGAPSAVNDEEGHVVIVQAGSQRVGFVVDGLIGQEEVVIKPLGALLQGLDGLAGATITGDGRISLILDIPGLMQRYA